VLGQECAKLDRLRSTAAPPVATSTQYAQSGPNFQSRHQADAENEDRLEATGRSHERPVVSFTAAPRPAAAAAFASSLHSASARGASFRDE
jgi:hypothetical protein